MQLNKHNLLDTVDPYIKQVAHEYGPRNAFAFEQHLSDAVKVVAIYNDDVDICFHFEVEGRYVDIYCNYKNPCVTGNVQAHTEAEATELLKTHFGLVITEADVEGNGFWYEAKLEEEVTA